MATNNKPPSRHQIDMKMLELNQLAKNRHRSMFDHIIHKYEKAEDDNDIVEMSTFTVEKNSEKDLLEEIESLIFNDEHICDPISQDDNVASLSDPECSINDDDDDNINNSGDGYDDNINNSDDDEMGSSPSPTMPDIQHLSINGSPTAVNKVKTPVVVLEKLEDSFVSDIVSPHQVQKGTPKAKASTLPHWLSHNDDTINNCDDDEMDSSPSPKILDIQHLSINGSPTAVNKVKTPVVVLEKLEDSVVSDIVSPRQVQKRTPKAKASTLPHWLSQLAMQHLSPSTLKEGSESLDDVKLLNSENKPGSPLSITPRKTILEKHNSREISTASSNGKKSMPYSFDWIRQMSPKDCSSVSINHLDSSCGRGRRVPFISLTCAAKQSSVTTSCSKSSSSPLIEIKERSPHADIPHQKYYNSRSKEGSKDNLELENKHSSSSSSISSCDANTKRTKKDKKPKSSEVYFNSSGSERSQDALENNWTISQVNQIKACPKWKALIKEPDNCNRNNIIVPYDEIKVRTPYTDVPQQRYNDGIMPRSKERSKDNLEHENKHSSSISSISSCDSHIKKTKEDENLKSSDIHFNCSGSKKSWDAVENDWTIDQVNQIKASPKRKALIKEPDNCNRNNITVPDDKVRTTHMDVPQQGYYDTCRSKERSKENLEHENKHSSSISSISSCDSHIKKTKKDKKPKSSDIHFNRRGSERSRDVLENDWTTSRINQIKASPKRPDNCNGNNITVPYHEIKVRTPHMDVPQQRYYDTRRSKERSKENLELENKRLSSSSSISNCDSHTKKTKKDKKPKSSEVHFNCSGSKKSWDPLENDWIISQVKASPKRKQWTKEPDNCNRNNIIVPDDEIKVRTPFTDVPQQRYNDSIMPRSKERSKDNLEHKNKHSSSSSSISSCDAHFKKTKKDKKPMSGEVHLNGKTKEPGTCNRKNIKVPYDESKTVRREDTCYKKFHGPVEKILSYFKTKTDLEERMMMRLDFPGNMSIGITSSMLRTSRYFLTSSSAHKELNTEFSPLTNNRTPVSISVLDAKDKDNSDNVKTPHVPGVYDMLRRRSPQSSSVQKDSLSLKRELDSQAGNMSLVFETPVRKMSLRNRLIVMQAV